MSGQWSERVFSSWSVLVRRWSRSTSKDVDGRRRITCNVLHLETPSTLAAAFTMRLPTEPCGDAATVHHSHIDRRIGKLELRRYSQIITDSIRFSRPYWVALMVRCSVRLSSVSL